MIRDDGETERLSFRNTYASSVRDATDADATLEAMAQLLDEQAENCNAHDFVCVHRGLAAILFQEMGREAATRVMRRIVNYEGLYGLVGVCGKGNLETAEAELGMSLHDWSDWSLANVASEPRP